MKDKKFIGFDCYKKIDYSNGKVWYDINEIFSEREFNKCLKEELGRFNLE